MFGPLPEAWGTQLPALQLLDVAICSFNGMRHRAEWLRSASPAALSGRGLLSHAAYSALAVQQQVHCTGQMRRACWPLSGRCLTSVGAA